VSAQPPEPYERSEGPPAVSAETRAALAAICSGSSPRLPALLSLDQRPAPADLDRRMLALVRIAVLIARDAPPASYAWHVGSAIEAGATADELLAVLRAVAEQAGELTGVAAAPEIMLALGLELPGERP
jgi:4-carboxymuconolactone decarboxylase